ncbi:hypothetical protein PDJAM_G00123120 [Pangasius djambal]|uniref:Uncharacterized protein n=1 Tax=Pangasius djambal TaxID=1691987 RepID=A0ACC5ZAF0_9TELE|nr:hypothetical protein [Pangasius djambal]
MAEELSKARLRLINGVNEALLKDLIDGLRDANPPVLTGREANEILQAHHVTEDKTGLLVDMVCNKGDLASAIMVSILERKDINLAKHLGFLQDQSASQQTPRMELNQSNLR